MATVRSAMRRGLVTKTTCEPCVTTGFDVSGKSRRDHLKHPTITVRIVERSVRGVTSSLRIWAADYPFPASMAEYTAGVVEQLANLDAATDQFVLCGPDIGDDQ